MNNETRIRRINRFIETLNQARGLGLLARDAGEDHLILELPYNEQLIGNPETGAMHSGAITTLMDTASGSVMMCALEELELCPTLDLRVDYMRPAEAGKAVLARAETYRVTRNIIFTRCEAYHEGGQTIANCVGTFMRVGKEATPKSYRKLITGEAE